MPRLSDGLDLLREYFRFARAHKIYWIVPLVVLLLTASVMIVVSQAAAPLLYTLF